MTRLLAKLFRLIDARAKAVVTQTGDCGVVSPKLQPHQRIERRKVHAIARQLESECGMKPNKVFAA
jgi:hypothetical protein